MRRDRRFEPSPAQGTNCWRCGGRPRDCRGLLCGTVRARRLSASHEQAKRAPQQAEAGERRGERGRAEAAAGDPRDLSSAADAAGAAGDRRSTPAPTAIRKRWLVDIGDKVQKDQLLAEIDSPDIDADVNQAKATLAQSDANVTKGTKTITIWPTQRSNVTKVFPKAAA